MVHAARSPSPVLSERRAATTDRILAAAMEILAERGLEGLTLKHLAQRLGYAVGALYRYFDSKDELLVELERRVAVDFHGALARASEEARSAAVQAGRAEGVTVLACIQAVVLAYADLATTAPAQFRLASLMLSDPRELLREEHGRRVMESLAPLLGDVRDLFAEAARCGALAEGDATDRTLSLWAGLHGSMQLAKLARFEPDRMNSRHRVEHLLDSLLAGWGASPSDLGSLRKGRGGA